MQVVREGELSAQSLADAVADEHQRRGGPCPLVLLVGSEELERVALRILDPSDLLSALRAGLPFVRVAGELPPRSWLLVESG